LTGLTVVGVKAEKRVGFHADFTRGLYLRVAPGGSKQWVFRFQLRGNRRRMGLGPVDVVTLAEARDAALAARRLVLAGQDPIDARRGEQHATALERAKAVTFAECNDLYLKAHQAAWKGTKNGEQWRSSMASYALPLIGRLPVAGVDTGLVLKVLEPIWLEKRVTADRVRRRIESVLDFAVAREWRPAGDNPARWRGHLEHLLARVTKPVEHYAALPHAELPGFMTALRERPGTAARALEFLILTACRADEVYGATWREFDLAGRTWTIPAERMKGKKGKERDHMVPLSDAALALLPEPGAPDAFVFPSDAGGKMYRHAFFNELKRMGVQVTAHGFRSTFRDWAAEQGVDHTLAEMALSHSVGTAVERAYRRTTMFEKRRALATRWARHCATTAVTGDKVVALRR
jgi:integrase